MLNQRPIVCSEPCSIGSWPATRFGRISSESTFKVSPSWLMKMGEPELSVAMPLNCQSFRRTLDTPVRFEPNGRSQTYAATSLFRTSSAEGAYSLDVSRGF